MTPTHTKRMKKNRQLNSFQAHAHGQFEGLELNDLKRHLGGTPKTDRQSRSQRPRAPKLDDGDQVRKAGNLPAHFNVWDRWPECKHTFVEIENQGQKCAAGWAVGSFFVV